MAIMRHSINFGGINSADFGIYISGEGVFNAPKRAVEAVTVPGRNGDIIIDLGHYENITVEYPAYIVENSLGSFSSQLRAFRNALSSQVGYQRLTDTIHTDEYRMATFIEGFETNVIKHNTAASISLKFNCKPQRWLTSGETKSTVTSGATLTNPTLYEANPVLEVKGYGTIEFNGYTIELEDGSYGDIELCPSGTYRASRSADTFNKELVYSAELFDVGDTLTVGISSVPYLWFDGDDPTGISSTVISPPVFSEPLAQTQPSTFTAGTPGHVAKTVTATVNWTGEISATGEPTSGSSVFDVTIETRYTSSLRMYVIVSATQTSGSYAMKMESWELDYGALTVKSNKTYLGDPTYIDCELGECYAIDNGTVIDLNSYVDLGSDLPKLAPGTNTITFDNTITELKLTPGWWQL